MSSAGLGRLEAIHPVSEVSAEETPAAGGPDATVSASRPRVKHYRRPQERPFLASERDTTTILIGGLTWRHEQFIKAVFEGSGYLCQTLPTPDQKAFQVGKEYGNNGQCSPAYFTSGSLIQYLKDLEKKGLSRPEIIDRYVFFTAGSCGPCRFGMYAAEYRMALQNAGFDGFRVLRFQQDEGVRQKDSLGLRYTLDFGLGMFNVLNLGDVLNDLAHTIYPYEVQSGETQRVMDACVRDACDHLREYKVVDLRERVPTWLSSVLEKNAVLRTTASVLYKFHGYLYAKPFLDLLERCRARINSIEVDRTRVKPTVKIIGEFWAQVTEGDGNYRMFDFLENEGAHVQTEAIGTWIMYLLAHAKAQMYPRRGMNGECEEPGRWDLRLRVKNEISFQKKLKLLSLGERIYSRQYSRIVKAMGGLAHPLVSQAELARLAAPYYKTLARGGEGYLEVGKNIYYNVNKLCHMVLSLKPFGCMPSSQSDGVQSAVVNRFKEMIYLPIETSGEGVTNAHSRVQMALGEARAKAKAEFQATLGSTGRTIEEIRAFVAAHPQLRRPLYPVPHRRGIAGVAATFVLHVHEAMSGRERLLES